jgi:mevalonate kinase
LKLVKTSAPGKCILFGEHAVVYNHPAIAMAISLNSTCEIQEGTNDKLQIILKNYNQSFEFSNLNDLGLNFPSQYNQIRFCLVDFQENFDLNLENIKITIASSLFPNSGLGSSASIAVALVTALNEFYKLNLEREKISDIAFEMEKIVHGTPSGIDNTICTFGNMIYYEAGKFRSLIIPHELKFLVSYTNIEHNTKEAIDKIKYLKNKNPKQTELFLNKIGEITREAEKELLNGNLSRIGKLMNRNQNLLTTLKVSNKTISEITTLALRKGAFGSKLTGAGLGGCVITLGKESVLNNLSSLLKTKGFKSFIINIDREGVNIEQ